MESFVLKNTDNEKKILLYQEKYGYSFSPKNGMYRVSKITVLNDEMTESILKDKVISKYNRLLKIIYSLINSEDTTSGDILVAYTEIDRLRSILLNKYYKYLKREFVTKYYKKLDLLEHELKKVHVMELENELEERGMGR